MLRCASGDEDGGDDTSKGPLGLPLLEVDHAQSVDCGDRAMACGTTKTNPSKSLDLKRRKKEKPATRETALYLSMLRSRNGGVLVGARKEIASHLLGEPSHVVDGFPTVLGSSLEEEGIAEEVRGQPKLFTLVLFRHHARKQPEERFFSIRARAEV